MAQSRAGSRHRHAAVPRARGARARRDVGAERHLQPGRPAVSPRDERLSGSRADAGGVARRAPPRPRAPPARRGAGACRRGLFARSNGRSPRTRGIDSATAGEFEAALGGRTSIKVWPLLLAIGLTLAAAVVVQQVWSRLSAPANSTPLVGTDAPRRGTWRRTSHRGRDRGRDLSGARDGRHAPGHLAGVGGEGQARTS